MILARDASIRQGENHHGMLWPTVEQMSQFMNDTSRWGSGVNNGNRDHSQQRMHYCLPVTSSRAEIVPRQEISLKPGFVSCCCWVEQCDNPTGINPLLEILA